MSPASRPVARGAVAVGVLATLVLAALAARADENAIGGHAALTARDVGVGLAFLLAAFAATGPARERLLVAAIGPAWLAGSLFQSALSLHQAVLGVALMAAPNGTIRNRLRLAVALLGSVLIVGEFLPQLAVAGYFLAVAALVSVGAERREATTTFASGASLVLAMVLAFGWWAVPRGTSNAAVLAIYQATLVSLALGLSAATWVDATGRRAFADQVLGGRTLAGLDGLRQVLALALHDDQLVIELVDRPEAEVIRDRAAGSRRQGVPVYDGDLLVATVSTRSRAIADGPTARAVATAVRLTAANLRLNEAQDRQASEVEASRARLLDAVDQERHRVAVRLQSEAGAHLERALAELRAPAGVGGLELEDLGPLVEAEVAAASAEVERIVAGVPPAALGSGRLGLAIAALAVRSPVPVVLELADNAEANAIVETALFYVCSEALTNIAQHSRATQAGIQLRRAHEELVLVVRDDGHGGADAEGSGLRGLRDRMATLGGRLVVDSPSGGGTVMTATAPIGQQ